MSLEYTYLDSSTRHSSLTHVARVWSRQRWAPGPQINRRMGRLRRGRTRKCWFVWRHGNETNRQGLAGVTCLHAKGGDGFWRLWAKPRRRCWIPTRAPAGSNSIPCSWGHASLGVSSSLPRDTRGVQPCHSPRLVPVSCRQAHLQLASCWAPCLRQQ